MPQKMIVLNDISNTLTHSHSLTRTHTLTHTHTHTHTHTEVGGLTGFYWFEQMSKQRPMVRESVSITLQLSSDQHVSANVLA